MTSLLLQEEHLRREIESPTPEWLDAFMKWALGGVPRFVQLWGGVLGVVVAIVVVALVVWKRHAILGWWTARSRGFRTGVGAAAVAAVVVAGGAGLWVWDYVQHDNEFCNSCHVMLEPYEKFQTSEHSELLCHDCHQQSMFASARQLYLWVLDRPEEIGPHAPVPTGVCAECHVTEDPDSTWQRISATAGHRVHLEADTSALADVQCVTCHGVEVHRFVPADQTCGQSGCHEPEKTEVVLGRMAGQTGFHCVTCHEFTAPVLERADVDTARMALVPRLEDCAGCHEMERILVGLDPEVDPHDAVCGTCHNPHTQEAPEEAAGRCAECHAPADTLSPFHRGIDLAVLEDCVGCHEAHTFAIDGEDCLACHADIVGGTPTAGPRRRGAERSSAPARDLDGVHAGPPPAAQAFGVRVVHDAGGPLGEEVSVARSYLALRLGEAEAARLAQRQLAGFDHANHRDIECTACHSMERTHGAISLESRAECLECHHTRPVVDAGCARCHGRAELSAVRSVTAGMVLAGRTRSRALSFDHDDHAGVGCRTCHGQGVRLAVTRGCASCHGEHHTSRADCASCHEAPAAAAHTREVHVRGCAGSGCHEGARYGAMTEGRNTCLACHRTMTDHRPGQACAACHQVTFAAAADPTTTVGRR